MTTKLLYVGDYGNTGFGQVAKGLLRGLSTSGKYEILQMGINFIEGQQHEEPWSILAASDHEIMGNRLIWHDPYGFQKLDSVVEEFDPDIVFVNNDYPLAKNYMVDREGNPKPFMLHRSLKVLYAPVDSEPVPKGYAQTGKLFDLNIAYSDWHRQLMTEHDPLFSLMPVLYHGYDPRIYLPMNKKLAKDRLVEIMVEASGKEDRPQIEERILGNFLVYFVGTNQFRKDLPCLFRAFAKFHDDVPNSVLLPHTNNVPMGYNGWTLKNLQVLTEVESAIIMNNANIFSEEEMNVFYNAADVLAYPTRGEGFGLPSLEAMAVKTPVIATAFGPQLELHSHGRGYFIEVLDVVPGDGTSWSWYALPDNRSLYKQLKFVYENPDHVAATVDRAYEFAKKFTWDDSVRQLDRIFDKMVQGNKDADNLQAN